MPSLIALMVVVAFSLEANAAQRRAQREALEHQQMQLNLARLRAQTGRLERRLSRIEQQVAQVGVLALEVQQLRANPTTRESALVGRQTLAAR